MPDPLGPRETEIMTILWSAGESTAEEVRAALPGAIHDSTVRSLLRILEQKGYVTHEQHQRRYVYRPVVERPHVEKLAVSAMLAKFFGGSVKALLLRLIEDEHLSVEELEEVKRSLKERAGKRASKSSGKGGRR